MSLRREFLIFVEREWPKKVARVQRGTLLYGLLYRAFLAGFKVGDEGPSLEAIGEESASIGMEKLISAPPQKFKPPRRARIKKR